MIDIREVLKQDFSLCLSQLFLSIKQISPIFIISFLFGYYITGQYKLIDQLISFFRSLTQVFLKFFYPKLCLEMIDDKKFALNFWKKYTFFLFSIVLLLLILILFFSKDVLLFFNVKSNNIYPLIYAFQASLLIPLLLVLVTALEQLMFIVQENKTYLKTIFYITFFNIFTILVFTQYWPLYGVIGAIILSEILFIIFYYYLAYKKVKSLIHV
jgi:O-antigen/teichoic acid export membrane protein